MSKDAPVTHDHDSYGQIEEQFQDAMDEGLNPAGPDVLYDLAAGLGLAEGAVVLDVGCGAGRHSIQLARRLGLTVRGIEPDPRSTVIARQVLDRASQDPSRPRATGELRAWDS
jgi:cyclopropane fatty-acyl-phospholipid synthase-like methyltransferase